MKRNHHINRYPSWLNYALLCIVFVLFLILNWMTPLWCDDLDYANDGRTFGAIFNKEAHDYLYHSGRFFSHSTVQLFAGILGKWSFNFVNAGMSLLLIVMTSTFFGQRSREKISGQRFFFLVTLALALVWFVLPDQFITMFMIAGSSNYIWAAVLNLAFVYVFSRVVESSVSEDSHLPAFGIVLSFFAGTWMEMYSIAILPAAMLLYLLKKGWKNRTASWMIALYAIGSAFVTLAPGNFVRQGLTVSGRPGFMTWVINQLEIVIRTGLIWVWFSTLLIFVIRFFVQDYSFRLFWSETRVFQVAILVSYAFIFVSGVSSYRAGWGVFVFSFAILSILLRGLNLPNYMCLPLSLILLAVVFGDFVSEYPVFRDKRKSVEQMVAQAKQGTLTDGHYYLWPEFRQTRKSIPDPVGEDGNWPGEYVAKYYQIPPFSIVPYAAFDYCRGNRPADSLFCDRIPLVGPYALFKLNENNGFQETVTHHYAPGRYVYRNRVARLMRAFGYGRRTRLVYEKPDQVAGGKLLLEKMETDQFKTKISRGDSQFFSFFYGGDLIVAYPKARLDPPYLAPEWTCTVE